MQKLNIIQRILFSIQTIVTVAIMILGPYLLFLGLFFYTGQIFYISLIPLWIGLEYYKHKTFTDMGYKIQTPVYKLKKDESDKVEE